MLGQNISLVENDQEGKIWSSVNMVLLEVFTLTEQVNAAHNRQNEYEI